MLLSMERGGRSSGLLLLMERGRTWLSTSEVAEEVEEGDLVDGGRRRLKTVTRGDLIGGMTSAATVLDGD